MKVSKLHDAVVAFCVAAPLLLGVGRAAAGCAQGSGCIGQPQPYSITNAAGMGRGDGPTVARLTISSTGAPARMAPNLTISSCATAATGALPEKTAPGAQAKMAPNLTISSSAAGATGALPKNAAPGALAKMAPNVPPEMAPSRPPPTGNPNFVPVDAAVLAQLTFAPGDAALVNSKQALDCIAETCGQLSSGRYCILIFEADAGKLEADKQSNKRAETVRNALVANGGIPANSISLQLVPIRLPEQSPEQRPEGLRQPTLLWGTPDVAREKIIPPLNPQ